MIGLRRSFTALATATLVAALFAPTYATAVTVISDGTFNFTDWAVTAYQTGFGGGVSTTHRGSGGNPTDYREVAESVHAGTATIAAVSIFTAQSYSPTSSGAITSLDFSLDYKCSPCISAGQTFGLAVMQGGNFYIDYVTITGATTAWHSSLTTGIVASDLSLFTNTAPKLFDSTMHPDFSASGSVLLFGFITANGAGGGGAYSETAGYDNFKITLDTVATPLPSTLPLFATGLAGFGWLVRRGRKAADRKPSHRFL